MTRSIFAAIYKQCILLLAAGGIAVGIWLAVLYVFDVNPLIGARPWDVWDYLVGAGSAERRAPILSDLGVTLGHASIGLAIALAVAFLISLTFAVCRPLEQSFMPLLLTLRTVPVITLTPVITAIAGNGFRSVAVIVFLTVFFPAVVLITQGMRSPLTQQVDLVVAYGGGVWQRAAYLQIPASIPSVSAALRIGVPVAVTGALLAEWLATGDGLGGAISRASGRFDYTSMWASMVLITATTAIAHSLTTIFDTAVRFRYGQMSQE